MNNANYLKEYNTFTYLHNTTRKTQLVGHSNRTVYSSSCATTTYLLYVKSILKGCYIDSQNVDTHKLKPMAVNDWNYLMHGIRTCL